MNTLPLSHPDADKLEAFARKQLPAGELADVEAHLARCDYCCRILHPLPTDTSVMPQGAGGAVKDTPARSGTLVESRPPAPKPNRTQVAAPAWRVPAELADHPRYRVVKVLGAGGMGVVYQAEHRLMERMVALKVINRDLTRDAQAVERFLQEVKGAARLAHPNIVAAHDAETVGDLHLLVMEYVAGTSLAQVVDKEGPLVVAQACNYVYQAALGLQHAFENGMVHRDIKPQNLMRTPGGQVKVLDFGLARLSRRPTGPDDTQSDDSGAGKDALTAVGAVLGTPDYIAPEQALDARRADVRSDIYSLGCTLFFLLVGHPPFTQGSVLDKLIAHVEAEPPPIRMIRPDVPPELATALERMMAKEPDHRFQTPDQAALALEPFALAWVEKPEKSGLKPRLSSTMTRVLEPPLPPPPVEEKKPARKTNGAWVVAMLAAMLAAAGYSVVNKLEHHTAPAEEVASGQQAGGEMPAPDQSETPPPSAKGKGLNASHGERKPAPRPTPPAKSLANSVLVVLPHNQFWYSEYGFVRHVLETGGVKVVVASSAESPATPHPNPKAHDVTPDVLLGNARTGDYDAVVFVSGKNSEYAGIGPSAARARKLIADMLREGKYVAALGQGTVVLAEAGVLKGKRATGPAPVLDNLVKGGANLVSEPVVVSGRIVTGRDWSEASAFGRKLLQLLPKKEQ